MHIFMPQCFCLFLFGLHDIYRFLVEDQEEEATLKRHSSALDMILTRSSAVFPSSFLGSTKSNRSESSFTRSRSSSMSSLEKESREGVQSVEFAESYTRKERQ
ncbi:hypothetical protein HOLleu_32184 [Holothuria leucospilota]|uniref:Uncharacterized protein n=1 Tax=Holothuria leucospilota TaxID=206669 RepID=A0A9Q0YTN1_HOLLE|nr:hypothetical protein HOLleu_32184 [Holothuria leucospilota]